MKSEKRETLRNLFQQSLERHQQHEKELSQLPRTVSPGDLFLFSLDVPVTCCAIFTHSKDDDLWFIVPGDDFSEVGTHDVAVPEFAGGGPLNFRCGHGLWVHVEDFDLDRRVGQLEAGFVEQIHDHLGRIVRSDLPDVAQALMTDEDPEYLEWMDELSAAVDRFEQILLDEAASPDRQIVTGDYTPASIYKFTPNWADQIGVETPTHLAADAKGIDTLPELDSGGDALLGAPIAHEGPGKLVAIHYGREIAFQLFELPEDKTPPAITANGVRLEWEQAGAVWATDEIAFVNGLVEFSINGEKQHPIEQS